MRLLTILLVVIQFTFAFHAVKTGRGAKWVFIIMLAPVVGCLAYYFLEVFPHSREERQEWVKLARGELETAGA